MEDQEIWNMASLYTLPVLRRGVKAHYEGSIDKTGGNADWDWHLYRDENGEWVLFEYEGSGCIYNFVQHRYPDCTEPVFRFYLDGKEEPDLVIRHSGFGETYPFTEPLASRYIGPYDNGRGPIRVVRSFAPMPFRKGMKITSDIELAGNERTKNEGGWGHVIYHAYSEEQAFLAQGARSLLTGEGTQEDQRKTAGYAALTNLFKRVGGNVIPMKEKKRVSAAQFTLNAGERKRIFTLNNATVGNGAMISGIRIRTHEYDRKHLKTLSVRAWWDKPSDNGKPDVEANFGCLFHNELGYHGVSYLLAGMTAEGEYYHYYPMPFERSAVIELQNTGAVPVEFDMASVDYTEEYNEYFRNHRFGYFRSSAYCQRKHTEGSDSVIAEITGNGHIIGSVITGFGRNPDDRADCEGDVRVYIDGVRTPQIESDGSESYSCYGWGFETPPESNPVSGYDGHEHKDWSMARTLPGDWYPFLSGVRFQIESGGCNDVYMEHSGMVFYYGRDEEKLVLLGEIVTGDSGSEQSFGYRANGAKRAELTSYFEGDDDELALTRNGYRFEGKCPDASGSRFLVKLHEDTDYVILRRVSDQKVGRQRARVLIDGAPTAEAWYFADHNPYKRWLEDEYVIPAKYVQGKEELEVRIVPERVNGEVNWNEFGYQIFGVRK